MSAARYNLVIDQGSDFALDLAISEDGSIKDLTGFSARAQMRSTKSSSTVAATFTCTVPDPTAGTVRIALGNSVSSGLTAGTYVYDLEIFTAGNASVTRLMEGDVTLTQEVTR